MYVESFAEGLTSFSKTCLTRSVEFQVKLERKIEFMNQRLAKSAGNPSQALHELQNLPYARMKRRRHLKSSVGKGNQINPNIFEKRREHDMECTSDEPLSKAVEKDGSGPNQLPDSIGFQNLSGRAQVLLGFY